MSALIQSCDLPVDGTTMVMMKLTGFTGVMTKCLLWVDSAVNDFLISKESCFLPGKCQLYEGVLNNSLAAKQLGNLHFIVLTRARSAGGRGSQSCVR